LLTHLEARGFRNLEPLSLDLGPGFHLVLGPNGAGKTSLLEAIYLLATTRSFRANQLVHCCRHGTRHFTLAGEVAGESRVRLELAWQDGTRQRQANGQRTSLAEHLAVLPVVAWTVADVEVLVGSPAERRRFLDRGVVGRRPAALDVLTRYRQALQEKRQLLRRHHRPTASELESWNLVQASAAAELIALRAAYAELLAEKLAETLERCGMGIPPIRLVYQPSPASGQEGAEQVFAALAERAPREVEAGSPLCGPHRDELRILWDGHDVRRVASAGERKALGLGLLAAHGEVLRGMGRTPTYLLDDADTELDRGRLEAVWKMLGEAGQVLATSNRPEVWESIEGRRLDCENGRVSSQEPAPGRAPTRTAVVSEPRRN
jgi:DNA replication and repair protein RecF